MRLPLLLAAALLAGLLAATAAGQAVRPATAAYVDDNYSTSGNRVVLLLKVRNAVKGTRAQVSCKGGRRKGCPAPIRGRTKTLVAKKRGPLSLAPALKGNQLARGAVVEIRLRDPKALYRRTTFTIESSSSVGFSTKCEQPDGSEVGCP